MSDFKAKMHQIRFPLGLRPRPSRGAYSAPPDPLAVFKGPTSKGREGKGGEEAKEREREGKTKEGEGCPPKGGSGSASEQRDARISAYANELFTAILYSKRT